MKYIGDNWVLVIAGVAALAIALASGRHQAKKAARIESRISANEELSTQIDEKLKRIQEQVDLLIDQRLQP